MARRRSPARWLAPLALAACALVIYAVVSASPVVDKDAASTPAVRTPTTTTPTTTVSASRAKRRTYTVKRGDVLSAIAERYGVPVSRLLELNPDVDASALRVGMKLRLRQ